MSVLSHLHFSTLYSISQFLLYTSEMSSVFGHCSSLTHDLQATDECLEYHAETGDISVEKLMW